MSISVTQKGEMETRSQYYVSTSLDKRSVCYYFSIGYLNPALCLGQNWGDDKPHPPPFWVSFLPQAVAEALRELPTAATVRKFWT